MYKYLYSFKALLTDSNLYACSYNSKYDCGFIFVFSGSKHTQLVIQWLFYFHRYSYHQ